MAFRTSKFLLVVEKLDTARDIPFVSQSILAVSLEVWRLSDDWKLKALLKCEEQRESEKGWVQEFQLAGESEDVLWDGQDVSYLSGGINSCAVLGFAARNSTTPIQAFTLTFDQTAYDEGEIAREMAALAGANFHAIPIKQSDIGDHFADAFWHSEAIFSNGHGVSKFLLSRAVRDAGYKVVDTGEGSDEILDGYIHFRTEPQPPRRPDGNGALD